MQKRVAATLAARKKNLAIRKDALTGTSDYPNLGEAPVKVLDAKPVSVPPPKTAVTFEGFPSVRMAEPYEALRDASDAYLKITGKHPQVFLANLGKPADFTTRATFAKNFYEAGGIEALSNDAFRDLAAMVAAFKASGVRLACLCSSDKIYETQAADAAKALSEAGAVVQLAGRPGEHEDTWRLAGVKTFIYAGCDALSTLRAAHDSLGMK
jgi:methylmalonyl-CoA mutase